MMRSMGLPVGFGKVSKKTQVAPLAKVQEIVQETESLNAHTLEEVGPMPEQQQDDDEDEEEDEEEEDEEEQDALPITHQVTLQGHTKVCISTKTK